MTREDLDIVDYDLKKLCCQVKGCKNGTKVRDYGISPHYYLERSGGDWLDLWQTIWLCGKHFPFIKRLQKSFDYSVICKKLYNPFPPCNVNSGKLIELPSKKTKLIENEFTDRLETRSRKTDGRPDRPSVL